MALAWEQLDGEDDESLAEFAALVAGIDIPSLSERLAAWRPPWMANAACRGAPVATFFPERGTVAGEAKRICAGCAVRAECLGYAVSHGEVGIWGGRSSVERRARER